jgi:murein DD-endopeptidase MepM/ murein hydrolase activator NlpD
MNVRKFNYSGKFFTPLNACLVIIAILATIVVWQFAWLLRTSQTLTTMSVENSDLKKSLAMIDGHLLELEDTASDVRVFQRELIKVINNIDQTYPVSFAEVNNVKMAKNFTTDGWIDTESAVNNASESIFKLTTSHESLRLETASLLGRAISMQDILDRTPRMMPVEGRISSGFGIRLDPFTKKYKHHYGIDVAAPLDTPVVASARGRVMEAGNNLYLGHYVRIDHGYGFVTVYGHMRNTDVKANQLVEKGQRIGRVGDTGRCSGAHLHFEMLKNGQKINPMEMIKPGYKTHPRPYVINIPPAILKA